MCKKSMCIECGHFIDQDDSNYYGKRYLICNDCKIKLSKLTNKEIKNYCDYGFVRKERFSANYLLKLPRALQNLAREELDIFENVLDIW